MKLTVRQLRRLVREAVMPSHELHISYGGHGGVSLELMSGGREVASLELPLEVYGYRSWSQAVQAIDAFVDAIPTSGVKVIDSEGGAGPNASEEISGKLQEMAFSIIGACDPGTAERPVGLDDPSLQDELHAIWQG